MMIIHSEIVIDRLLRRNAVWQHPPRNDNARECGAECGERVFLSTKDGQSLPLRHLLTKRSRIQSGTLLFYQKLLILKLVYFLTTIHAI